MRRKSIATLKSAEWTQTVRMSDSNFGPSRLLALLVLVLSLLGFPSSFGGTPIEYSSQCSLEISLLVGIIFSPGTIRRVCAQANGGGFIGCAGRQSGNP